MQRLSALDAAFLALEDDVQPLHVGSLLLLEGPPPAHSELGADLAQVTVLSDAAGPNLVNTAKWLGLISSTSNPLTLPQLARTGAPFDPISVALWASLLLALGVMFLVFGRRDDEYEG